MTATVAIRTLAVLLASLGDLPSEAQTLMRTTEISGLGIHYQPLGENDASVTQKLRAADEMARDYLSKGNSSLRAGCFAEAKFYFCETLKLRWQYAEATAGLELAQQAESILNLPNPSSENDPRLRVLRDTQLRLSSIELGMTRVEVEKFLGADWVNLITANWASGQHAVYRHRQLTRYKLVIVYDWVGKRGIGRRSQPIDPVIRIPKLVSE